MDENKENCVDSILNSPKPTATSTVMKKNSKKKLSEVPPDNIENSYGRLSLNNSSLLGGFKSIDEEHNLSKILEKQRLLAEQSLKRLSSLPSKYLRPNNSTESECSNVTGSTISESDLLLTPKNQSTPRSSLVSNLEKESRPSIGHTMSQLSKKLTNTDISIENFIKEFQESMNISGLEIDSQMFVPAEGAKSQLFADEMSWRNKNDIPVKEESFSTNVNPDGIQKFSMTEFFKQRSNKISDLQVCESPRRGRPVPLVPDDQQSMTSELSEISSIFSKKENSFIDSKVLPKLEGKASEVNYQKTFLKPNKLSKPVKEVETQEDKKVPSISDIVNLLAQTHTPNKIMNLLFQDVAKKDSLMDESELAIPVSKNVSYTSNYSDNEALQEIDKFRQETDEKSMKLSCRNDSSEDNSSLKSGSSLDSLKCSSGRSSSCLSNLPNGKLPLESTKSELVWGCVKVDKCDTKEFLLRNKCPKTIRIQLTISGSNFKLRRDGNNESDPLGAAKLLLHGNESRQIFVSFNPIKNGAACEELIFTSLDFPDVHSKKQSIKLYGYGGYLNVDLISLPKYVSGKYMIDFGTIDNNMIVKKFMVRNNGSLAAFCYYQFIKRQLTTFTNIIIKPNFFCIIPGEEIEVTVSYHPSVNDHKYLQSSKGLVLEIGTIKMIYGSEVNRARLRRLCRKAAEASIEVDPICKVLIEKIKGEVIPLDVSKIRDGVHSLPEVMQFLKYNEIVATIEQDPEQTLMPQLLDETDLFTTLCGDTTVVDNSMFQKDSSKLEPSSVILLPPLKTEDSLFLISKNSKVMYYETQSNPPGLEVTPKEGKVLPGETVILKVKYTKCLSQKQSYKIIVYLDNAVLEAEVKVFYVNKNS